MRDVARPPPSASGRGTDKKKVVQTWKGHKMLRAHSFLSTIESICRWSKQIDVARVGIIGDMGSGKTTMATAIAHAFHERMKVLYDIPFAVRLFEKKHLLKFRETLDGLAPANYVLIFDDVSFLESDASKHDLASIKQAVTTIRHFADRSTKMLLIYNYHYSLGLDKFLRQVDFQYWTSAGASEGSNMERIFHNPKAMRLVATFRRQRAAAIDLGQWTARYGRDGSLTYRWRDPWIPALYFDPQHRLRPIISPSRKWLAPHCPTCAASKPDAEPDDITPAEFVAKAQKSFGPYFLTALKLVALENGLPVYSRGALAAKKALEAALRAKAVSLEGLLVECNLSLNKSRVRAGFSKFLDSIDVAQAGAQAPAADGAAATGAAAGSSSAPALPPDQARKPASAGKTRPPPRIL